MLKTTSLSMMVMGLSLLALTGCGGASTPEGVMKESIAQMNEMASAMENAKKASDVKPKVDAAVAKLSELSKKLDAMKVTEEQKKELEKKLGPDLQAAVTKMMGAMMKLTERDPEGMKTLSESMAKMKK